MVLLGFSCGHPNGNYMAILCSSKALKEMMAIPYNIVTDCTISVDHKSLYLAATRIFSNEIAARMSIRIHYSTKANSYKETNFNILLICMNFHSDVLINRRLRALSITIWCRLKLSSLQIHLNFIASILGALHNLVFTRIPPRRQ